MKSHAKKRLKRWMKKRKIRRQLSEHHDRLWQLGEFYCSEYVKVNQPWIAEIPFWQFVERQVGREGERVA